MSLGVYKSDVLIIGVGHEISEYCRMSSLFSCPFFDYFFRAPHQEKRDLALIFDIHNYLFESWHFQLQLLAQWKSFLFTPPAAAAAAVTVVNNNSKQRRGW
jgi:hypothetical protein